MPIYELTEMRKFRKDAKPIPMLLAIKLYWEGGGTLTQIARAFKVDPANLLMRFRRFDIPLRSPGVSPWGKKSGRTGDKNPLWRGGFSIDKAGYVLNNRTRRREHREIAERVLGRPLRRKEVVHHWKKPKSNNENSNLLICEHWYHNWLEAKLVGWKIGINHKKEG